MRLNNPIATSLPWVFIVGYALLVILRVPDIIWPGRFWAEEATVYLAEALNDSPSKVLLSANLGYYSLFNKLAALAAVYSVPLEWAPLVTTGFAFVVQLIPAFLLAFSRFKVFPNLISRGIALALFLLIQPNQEIWLNTINSQFFFCVATGLILISTPSRNVMTHLFRLGILVLAGLTGMVSALLWPLFILEYIHHPNARKRDEMIVLGVATAIQASVVLLGQGRSGESILTYLPFTLFHKQWLVPLAGYSHAQRWVGMLTKYPRAMMLPISLVFMAPYIALSIIIWRTKNWHSFLLLVASLSVAVISLMFSKMTVYPGVFLESVLDSSSDGRYLYAPNVFLALGVLSLVCPQKEQTNNLKQIVRLGLATCLFCILLTGVYSYRLYGWWSHGPIWRDQVALWRSGETEILKLWPESWDMFIPLSYRDKW